MKNILIILLLPLSVNAQLASIIVKGDTLFSFNPLTKAYTQLTKMPYPTINKLTDSLNSIRILLSGKQDAGSYALSSHTHAYNTITGLPTIPTNTNQLTNGAGFLVAADIAGKLNTNGSAANLTNFPTLNQNTSGTASNVTGVVAFANGGIGSGATTSATTGTMTVSMATEIITITPTGPCTFNASGGVTGQRATFVVTTSGTSSFVLTFGTNFKSVGTLATGTTTGKIFAVTFLCTNGTQWIETNRTAAQ